MTNIKNYTAHAWQHCTYIFDSWADSVGHLLLQLKSSINGYDLDLRTISKLVGTLLSAKPRSNSTLTPSIENHSEWSNVNEEIKWLFT